MVYTLWCVAKKKVSFVADEWQKVSPHQTDDFHATLHGLDPDTKYEVMAISQVRDPNTNEVYQAESMVVHVRTQGGCELHLRAFS